MLTQTAAIARNAFVESVRQPILFILVLLSGILQVFNTWNTGFSMADTESSQVSGDTKLLFDIGLATIFVIATVLAAFIATAVISREIENKTVLTVVSKPIGRPSLILGKFLGVAGAIMASVVIMLVFLLLAVRHGVMSTTAEGLDGPVIFFGVGAVFLSLSIAGWCNYFYGWNFPQTVVTALFPLSLIAYVLVLFLNKHWMPQPLSNDFKDQIVIVSLCLGLAVFVLTSVALALSTRLGQVATLVLCMGVFLLALLSNYLIGRHVFRNDIVGQIETLNPDDTAHPDLLIPGTAYTIEFRQIPDRRFQPGEPVYFSRSPNGFPMLETEPQHAVKGDITDTSRMLAADVPPAIVAVDAQGSTLHVRHVGGRPLHMTSAPEPGDYVFQRRTRVSLPALAAWGAIPNLQFFWLVDAVSQNRPVPGSYLGLITLYAFCQVGVFLSLAVILFQRRDIG